MKLKRDQLLVPGKFISIPASVMRSMKLLPTAKLVYGSLLNRLGDGNIECWPGVSRIADENGISERTAQHAIKNLVDAAYIQRRWVTGRSSRYSFLPLTVEDDTPESIAPQQDLHPVDSAEGGRKTFTTPPQNLHETPAEPAPKLPKELLNETSKLKTKGSGFNKKPQAVGNNEGNHKGWKERIKINVEDTDDDIQF